MALGVVAALALVLWLYGSLEGLTLDDFYVASEEPRTWRVSLNVEGDEPLGEKEASLALEIVTSTLTTGDQAELAQVARMVQKEGAYAMVHLVKTGIDQVTLRIKRRKPYLCVAADRLRFLTKGGVIYGAATPETCPGPVIHGVFSERAGGFEMTDDHALAVSDKEAAILEGAISLFEATKARGLAAQELRYLPYRGFGIRLTQSGADILVGKPPFDETFARLSEILAKLEEKGEVAERIELDYQGKAFVKSKKL